MYPVSLSEYGARISETVFALGPDRLLMALLDHAARGFELQLFINGRFFFSQVFDDASAASHAARNRCDEYESDGWVVQPFWSLADPVIGSTRAIPTSVSAA